MRHRLLLLLLLAVALLPLAGMSVQGGRIAPPGLHGDKLSAAVVQEVRETLREQRALTPSESGFATPALAAEEWCGEPTTSNRADLTSAPDVKVIYAYASDQPNDFGTYKTVMQDTARAGDDVVAAASSGSRHLRWDVGSSCGAEYLDIQTVKLPRSLLDYTGNGFEAQWQRTFGDVRAALGITGQDSAGTRNFLVFADKFGLGNGAVYGQGDVLLDSSSGAGNRHNRGSRVAVVYGLGRPDFFFSRPDTYANALHEVTHTLGAVQLDAPHTTGAFHCNDGADIMCSGDGGPTANYETVCNSAPVLDCNGDDYFNPAPAAGGYLATHWNLYDSAFLCVPGNCFDAPNQPPVPDISGPDRGRVGDLLYFSSLASADPDGQIVARSWTVDGAASGSGATLDWAPKQAGQHRIRLTVTDDEGASVSAEQTVTVTAPPSQPPPSQAPVGPGAGSPNVASPSETPAGAPGPARFALRGLRSPLSVRALRNGLPVGGVAAPGTRVKLQVLSGGRVLGQKTVKAGTDGRFAARVKLRGKLRATLVVRAVSGGRTTVRRVRVRGRA